MSAQPEEHVREMIHENGTTTWVVRGDALALPLDDDCVDLVVTSPPYFGLRSYQDGGKHYDGQIGAEATPAEFVDALIAATREMVRVVKPSGSIWVNLGDKYSGPAPTNPGMMQTGRTGEDAHRSGRPRRGADDLRRMVPSKSLIGIPWRYALRCIDDLGLILRAEVIWSKPNGLPESVTDRVRRSHETWFHFTLNPRYYSAVDEIREEYEAKPQRRFSPRRTDEGRPLERRMPEDYVWEEPTAGTNPLGKLPGSVWTIPTEPLRVPDHLGIDHFAAFPTEWPRRIITGWSPRGVCVECGTGRRPVADVEQVARRPIGLQQMHTAMDARADKGTKSNIGHVVSSRTITGEACDCPEPTAPTTPGVVLDPFGGTGTTALVASVLGRDAITLDLSGDYCRLAEWRVSDPRQRETVSTRNRECPRCGSRPGERCTSNGKTVTWHKERKAP